MRRAVALALIALASGTPLSAAPAGVAELVRQAKFWSARGRGDLARQAAQRALALDPGNAEARRIVSGGGQARPQPSRQTEAPAIARPRATQPSQPRAPAPRQPAPRRDTVGEARAAGFEALERGDLNRAANRFQVALRARPDDSDALGGLGLVRLRTEKFAEARDLLTRASRGGDSSRWLSALRSASFFADLREGEAARDTGRLDEAEAIARRLAGSDAEDRALAQTLLGDVLSRQGRYGEAASAYTAAAASGSPTAAAAGADLRARAAREQAQEAAARGDVAGAERLFQSAIVANPDDPWMRYEYARFLVQRGQTVTAITTMAPLDNVADPEGLFAAALFSNQIGRPGRASELMQRIPPGSLTQPMRDFLIEVRITEAVEQADRLRASGRITEALAGLRTVASIGRLPLGGLAALAGAFAEAGATVEAQELAMRALQEPLGEPAQYEGIVAVLATTGQDGAAASLVERLSASAPPQAVAGLRATLAANQADRLRLSGDNATAFDILQAAWAAAPGNADILASLARLYQGGGMPGQAAQVYAMLLSQKADDKAALMGMADASAAVGDYAAARAAARRGIEVAPEDPEMFMAAARVEQAAGDKGRALRYLRQAQELIGSRFALGNGAFPAGNPFARTNVATPAMQNPFALSSRASAPAAPSRPWLGQGSALIQPAPSPFGQSPPAPGAPGLVADPTMAQITRQIAELSGETGPAVSASANFRDRSGESGLSKLTEIGATIGASTDVGGARIGISASPVVVDSGGLSRSATARFGTNPTAEAQGIADQLPSDLATAETQHDAGVAISASVESGSFKADVGTTPIGFRHTNVQGGVSWSPRIGQNVTLGIHGEYRPVTDSVLSYAGTVDPATGAPWGSVMRAGGGASLSYDRGGSGVYVDGAYRRYRGRNVLRNESIEANVGGYVNAYRSDTSSLTIGANLNYQDYDNNQNFFSFGHGGYFSPQSFVALAFPIRYRTSFDGWQVNADLSPGYQSYEQDAALVYPTLAASQAVLDALKAQNNDVRAGYDSLSESGFAFQGSIGATYQLGEGTTLGGDVKYNSFGVYKEFQTMLRIRQSLGGE